MKKKPFLYFLLAAFCTLTSLKCDDKDEDPSVDMALFYGKWKVVQHEGKSRLTAGQPGVIVIGPYYRQPYKIEGGDSLFWQFHQGDHMTVIDPYLTHFVLRDNLGESIDSITFFRPLDMSERSFQWTFKNEKLELQQVSPRPRYVIGSQFKIEKLTSDSLVLEYFNAIDIGDGTLTPVQTWFVTKVRLARLQ